MGAGVGEEWRGGEEARRHQGEAAGLEVVVERVGQVGDCVAVRGRGGTSLPCLPVPGQRLGYTAPHCTFRGTGGSRVVLGLAGLLVAGPTSPSPPAPSAPLHLLCPCQEGNHCLPGPPLWPPLPRPLSSS